MGLTSQVRCSRLRFVQCRMAAMWLCRHNRAQGKRERS